MSKLYPPLLVICAALIGLLLGYLLGSGPTSAVSIKANGVREEVLRQLVREEVDAAVDPLISAIRNGGGPVPRGSSGAAVPLNSDARTPSLDVPIEDLEKAIERLNRAVATMQKQSTAPLSSQVQLAKSGLYPQKSDVVRSFCRRWENDDRDEEIKRKELLFLSPLEILERFGQPNAIELEVGSLYWEYSYNRETPEGMTIGWDMYLVFTDGAVMDASCSFYDDDD